MDLRKYDIDEQKLIDRNDVVGNSLRHLWNILDSAAILDEDSGRRELIYILQYIENIEKNIDYVNNKYIKLLTLYNDKIDNQVKK